jgi:hypothetical protein
VLVIDHRAWERTVRGYAERRWSTGGRQPYRLYGRACRPPGAGDPLAVFDLTAVSMGTDGADRGPNWTMPAPFRMTVDDRRGGVLGSGGLVVVDMRACRRDQVRAAIERLARVAPPRVRLRVESAVAPRVAAIFSVQIVGRRPQTCPPSRVTAAT